MTPARTRKRILVKIRRGLWRSVDDRWRVSEDETGFLATDTVRSSSFYKAKTDGGLEAVEETIRRFRR